MDAVEPLFPIARVAPVSGVKPGTIRTWKQRGHLRLIDQDRKAQINGQADLFSLRGVLGLAAMGALVRQGIDPAVAGDAARAWITVGTEDCPPGELYSDPLTVLCVYPTGWSEVKHLPLKTARALDLFLPQMQSRQPSVTAVILDTIVNQVRSGLGLA
jgi:hypothetical protein